MEKVPGFPDPINGIHSTGNGIKTFGSRPERGKQSDGNECSGSILVNFVYDADQKGTDACRQVVIYDSQQVCF